MPSWGCFVSISSSCWRRPRKSAPWKNSFSCGGYCIFRVSAVFARIKNNIKCWKSFKEASRKCIENRMQKHMRKSSKNHQKMRQNGSQNRPRRRPGACRSEGRRLEREKIVFEALSGAYGAEKQLSKFTFGWFFEMELFLEKVSTIVRLWQSLRHCEHFFTNERDLK